MKNIQKRLLSAMMLLALALAVTAFRPVPVHAATKTVKNLAYSPTMTSKIQKYATVVKKGTSTLKVTKSGYLKFKVPATKTYTFTFYGMTASNFNHNNGYAYLMTPVKSSYSSSVRLDKLTFKTTGGKATTAWYHTPYLAETKKTTSAFLAKRACKLKLKKGQTVYLYLSFASKGSIKMKLQ